MSTTGAASAESEPKGESAFRWRLTHRPDTRFGHAAGGVAGILVVAAGVAFTAAIDDDDPQMPGMVISAVLIVAAVLVGYWVRGPVRSTAVTTLVLAAPALWIFAVFGENTRFERSDTRLVLLLVAVSYVALYLLTWTRGRAVFLGAAVFVLVNWFLFEIADSTGPFGLGAAEEFQQRGPTSALFGNDNSRSQAIMTVVIALGLLGAGVVLDRRRVRGVATPLLVVGSIYAVIGAVALGADIEDVYATGILVAIAGLAIGIAGGLGQRRATSWLGALVLLAGAVTIVAQGTEDTASGSGGEAAFGAFALIAAAVLLVIGVLVAGATDEPLDGGEPFVAPPPSGPEPAPAVIAATTEPSAMTEPSATSEPTEPSATSEPTEPSEPSATSEPTETIEPTVTSEDETPPTWERPSPPAEEDRPPPVA